MCDGNLSLSSYILSSSLTTLINLNFSFRGCRQRKNLLEADFARKYVLELKERKEARRNGASLKLPPHRDFSKPLFTEQATFEGKS